MACLILQEWEDLEDQKHKKGFPFEEDIEEKFFKLPKLDAPLSQVTNGITCPLRMQEVLRILWTKGQNPS